MLSKVLLAPQPAPSSGVGTTIVAFSLVVVGTTIVAFSFVVVETRTWWRSIVVGVGTGTR